MTKTIRKILTIGMGSPILQMFAYDGQITRTKADALIPTEVATEILSGIPQASTIMQLATKAPNMSSKQKRMPVLANLPTAYFVNGDTGLKQTTDAAWDNKFLDAEELAVIVPISEAVLSDAEYDIWGQIKPLITEALGAAFDKAVLYGTNAPASWPTNVLTSCTNAGHVVTLGTGADIYDDILGENGAISLVEQSGFMATGHCAAMSMRGKLRNLRDASGMPIFKTGVQGATSYELDGSPMFFPKNGAMDPAQSLMFTGDFKQLIYAMRQDITYKILDQAVIQDNTGAIVYNLAQQDMVALRVVMRLAWQVPNPINSFQPNEAQRYPFAVLTP